MIKVSLVLLAVFALLFVMTGSSSSQEPDQDDPESNLPASCDNYKNTAAEHRCACGKATHDDCEKPTPSVQNDSKCLTNCKPSRCRCLSHCAT